MMGMGGHDNTRQSNSNKLSHMDAEDGGGAGPLFSGRGYLLGCWVAIVAN